MNLWWNHWSGCTACILYKAAWFHCGNVREKGCTLYIYVYAHGRKAETRKLHLGSWFDPLGKRRRKRGKANFFCKHPEFSKWIVKDKQKATLGTACSHHHHCQITMHALFFFFIFIQISFSCKNMVLLWVYEAISSNWHEFLEIL